MNTLCLSKRKRSFDAVSDSGTCSHTEQTEESSPRRDVDAKSQLMAQRREQHVERKLQLEEQIKQVQQQKQHVTGQLEQLEGCECSRDALGISDLRAQLQAYQQQEQAALDQLAELDRQFEAAVADILGIPAEQQANQLARAIQEQQQLQEVQAQQLVVEQQLARSDFAVTDSSKHQAKRARLDRISQVWDWLQDSTAVTGATAPVAATDPGQATGDFAPQQPAEGAVLHSAGRPVDAAAGQQHQQSISAEQQDGLQNSIHNSKHHIR